MRVIAPGVVVERLYQCRVDWDIEYDDVVLLEKIQKKIEAITLEFYRPDDPQRTVTLDERSAGPAWNAYVVFTGRDEEQVTRAVRQFVLYLRRFRSARVLE